MSNTSEQTKNASDRERIIDTIFISHANPEDNDFVIWLASRLQLLGYKVWVDKEAMLGGEKMWEVDRKSVV